MCAGCLAIGIIFFTRETRGSVILSKRAKKLRKETGDERYQCRSDAERASLAVMLKVSLTRPLCKLTLLLLARPLSDESVQIIRPPRHGIYRLLLLCTFLRSP